MKTNACRAAAALLLSVLAVSAASAGPADGGPCETAALDALHCGPASPPADAPALAAACDRALAAPATLPRLAALAEFWRNAHPHGAMREAARACSARMEQAATLTAAPTVAPAAAARIEASLARLEREFERRLTEHSPRLRFAPQAVQGLDPGWLQAARTPDGRAVEFGIGLKDYYPFMRQVHDGQARRRMYLAHANRGGPANVQTLQQIVAARQRLAAASGQAHHLDRLAAASPGLLPAAEVAHLLATLGPAIRQAAADDLATLARLHGRPLQRWDTLYAIERAREQFIGLAEDDEAARMPVPQLLPWLQRYFGPLAGVRFEAEPRTAWHADVQCLRVHDLTPAQPLGTLCLDLLPREGKYYNHASFDIPPLPGGPASRLAVLLANTDPLALGPDEVERLFAEFSVALGLLTAHRQGGNPAPQPALWQQLQRALFEQLAFSDEALALLPVRPDGRPALAPALRQAIRDNRLFASALAASRQWTVAQFDFELATAAAGRPTPAVMARWRALENASGLAHVPGSHYPGRLNALAGPQAGLYFSLLWREAAAIDLLRRFADASLQPPAVARLRQAFFEPPSQQALLVRYAALNQGQALSLQPYLQQLADNTIAAQAARRRAAGLAAAGHAPASPHPGRPP